MLHVFRSLFFIEASQIVTVCLIVFRVPVNVRCLEVGVDGEAIVNRVQQLVLHNRLLRVARQLETEEACVYIQTIRQREKYDA